jgi:cell division septation protein DedD
MTTEPRDEPRPTVRVSGHAKRPASPLSGLKPFLLAGLLVVIGLLVGLNFLLGGSGDSSVTNPEPTPGAITIGPPPGGGLSTGDSRGNKPPPASTPSSPSQPGATPSGRSSVAPSEFTFYETLKKPPHDPAATVGLTPPSSATKPAPKPAPSPSAVAEPKPAKPPSAAKPPAPKNHVIDTKTAENRSLYYTVQVAAFREQSMAEEMIKALNKKGHDAYLATASSQDGGMTFRVRVGRYSTRGEADRVAKLLAIKEKLHPFVATVQAETEEKG